MTAARLVLAFALVGGGVAAYRMGYLNKWIADAGLTPVQPQPQGPLPAAEILPVLGNEEYISVNQWEAVLRRNWSDVHPWAQANHQWVAAQMKQESGGLGASAVSSAGALGVLQVLPATALQMFNSGYDKYPGTASALHTEAGGVYFGTAYLQYLSRINSSRAWITKAYFGGPGWEGKGPNYRKQCEDYFTAVNAQYSRLYGGLV